MTMIDENATTDLPPGNVTEIKKPKAKASQAVAVREAAPVAASPLDVINRAIAQGISGDSLKQLMDLQERWEATNARKAFDEAIANAKAEIPVIFKNAKSHNNTYADMAAIARTVDPVLSRHGLRYRFRTQQTEKTISVTCVLTHKDGHAEENTLTGPIDATVGRNPIQAIGSTCTYLQRYSLVQALGLAASDDDDGRAAGAMAQTVGTITADQLKELQALIDEVGADAGKVCKACHVAALEELTQIQFQKAKAKLESMRTPL